jgi:hypothetical protein
MRIERLPVIDVDESEKITDAVRADDLLEGDMRTSLAFADASIDVDGQSE